MRSAYAIAALMLCLMASCPTTAATVYTWTDAQGVRHFSQYPPEDPAQPAKTLSYTPAPPGQDSGERLQNIRDVARDLEISRQQREEQRAKAAPPPATPPPEPEPEPPYVIVPYPYGRPYPPPYPYPHPPEHRPGTHRPDPHRPGPDEPEDPGVKPIAPKREPGGRSVP